jgi:rare lipoprotein A
VFNVFKRFLKLVSLVGLGVAVASLSGCALMSSHYTTTCDNAPDFNVDVSQIPNAVPRQECHPRFCNPSHYTVCGKTYKVLHNPKSYCVRGIASWYGTRFYKEKTSSGETYNMFAMTAANKTLPIPCYVRVTDLRTNHCIVVKVNDRGPFKRGRIIDLSYAAAKKLGITRTGTAPVEVTLLQPGQSTATVANYTTAAANPVAASMLTTVIPHKKFSHSKLKKKHHSKKKSLHKHKGKRKVQHKKRH